MSGIANDADVGRDPLAGEGDSFEIMAAGQGEVAGGGFCRAPAGEEIALEPQAIVPSLIATPPDHRRGSVEAVSEQNHPQIGRQPAGDHREQLLLRSEANGARGFLDPPSQWQSAPELVEGRPTARSASGSGGDRRPWSGRGSAGSAPRSQPAGPRSRGRTVP